jgi:hypothetical protein
MLLDGAGGQLTEFESDPEKLACIERTGIPVSGDDSHAKSL